MQGVLGKPSIEQLVEEKIKILREFYAVDNNNVKQIERELFDAVNASPNRDYEIVLEQITQKIIMDHLGDV